MAVILAEDVKIKNFPFRIQMGKKASRDFYISSSFMRQLEHSFFILFNIQNALFQTEILSKNDLIVTLENLRSNLLRKFIARINSYTKLIPLRKQGIKEKLIEY